MDELDEIIIADEEVDKTLLRDIAKGNFVITASGKIIYDKSFHKRTGKAKVVLFLVARKIMALKKIGDITSEKCSEKVIAANTGMPLGSVRTAATELKGIMVNDGGYYIPNFNISRLSEVMK